MELAHRQQTRSAVRVAVGTVLDAELPAVYGPELFDQKVSAVFDHIYASYYDNGDTVHEAPARVPARDSAVATLPATAEEVSDDLLVRVTSDPELCARLMETVFGASATWACTTEDLLTNDESRPTVWRSTLARSSAGTGNSTGTGKRCADRTLAGLVVPWCLLGSRDGCVGMCIGPRQSHVCAARKVRRWSVRVFGWSMGMRVRLSSTHTSCVFWKCWASRSAWVGGMSLSSRAQTMRTGPLNERCWSAHSSSCWGLGDVGEVLVEVAPDLAVVAQRVDPAPEQVVGDPLLGQGAEGQGEMADPAWAQQLGCQEGAAGQRCVTAEQPAGQAGRVVVEGLAGDQDQVGDTIGAAGADDELRAAPLVADECDVAQVEFGEELGDHGGDRREGEVSVVGHRRGVRAERQLGDDAAVAIPQALHDGVPQGAVHQHPVQQHHHRPVAAGVGVHEAGSRRPLELHPQTPLPVGAE